MGKSKKINEEILFIVSDKKDKLLCRLNDTNNIEVLCTVNYQNELGSMLVKNSFLDFTIFDNEVFFISGGSNNGIAKFKINPNEINKIELISDLNHSQYFNVIKKQNKLYMIQNNELFYESKSFDEAEIKEENLLSYSKSYYNNFYQTENDFQSFLPAMVDNGVNNSKISNLFNFDINSKEMILGYYESKAKKYGFYDNLNSNSDYANFRFTPYKDNRISINSNLHKNQVGELYLISYTYLNPNSYSSEIEVLSKDYKNIQTKNFSKKNYFYINNNNDNIGYENTLLEYDLNTKSKYIVTTDKSLGNIKQEIEFKNVYINKFDTYSFKSNEKDYLVFTNYYRDSTLDINLYDIAGKSNKVLKFVNNPELDILNQKVFYTFDNDTLFIAIKDSVFYIDYKNQLTDLNLYCILPNNGHFLYNLQKFDNELFGIYKDDVNPKNFYKIMYSNKNNTSVENIEEVNYLYTTPPYPNPTISEVTAKFYWDSRIDIDNSDIAVFDITGNKVSGKENLTLEKLNEWSGNIKWNCANQPKGTYLIKIQHGNNTKTVKVVVD